MNVTLTRKPPAPPTSVLTLDGLTDADIAVLVDLCARRSAVSDTLYSVYQKEKRAVLCVLLARIFVTVG